MLYQTAIDYEIHLNSQPDYGSSSEETYPGAGNWKRESHQVKINKKVSHALEKVKKIFEITICYLPFFCENTELTRKQCCYCPFSFKYHPFKDTDITGIGDEKFERCNSTTFGVEGIIQHAKNVGDDEHKILSIFSIKLE